MTGADLRLSEAVVLWTGHGQVPYPARDEALVVERFGNDAVLLMPLIRALEGEFYESNARHVAADVHEMAELSAAQFRARHPDLTEEAVQALTWCYTWDYR